MNMKQVVFLLLSLVPVWTKNVCVEHHRLHRLAKTKNHHQQVPQHPVNPDPSPECPVEQFRLPSSGEYKDRSLSPWTYVTRTLEDHFPPTYSEAKCLCRGCIQFQNDSGLPWMDDTFNSVPVIQNKLFYRKKHCKNETYELEPVNVRVAVACICVRPVVSSS